MSDIRTSFNYSPIRQGYDTNSWRTVSGSPTVDGSGRITIDNTVGIAGSAIHYADFLKGDVSMNVNVPVAPVAGTSRLFGMAELNSGSYIRFNIGSNLVCETSNGTLTTTSSSLTWDTNWTGANTIFNIRWEGGGAKFFINGTQIYAVSDATVPHGPLSLYFYDGSESPMTIGDISVKGTQSFVMNPKTSDATPTNPVGTLSIKDNSTLTENVSLLVTSLFIPYSTGSMSDSVTVSENFSAFITEYFDSLTDNVTLTESLSLVIDPLLVDLSSDVTVTEDFAHQLIT